MQTELHGNPDYGELRTQLEPGDRLLIESGAMSRMSPELELKTRIMGGFLPAAVRKLFGGESFFVGEYGGPTGGELCLSPALPGTVLHEHLEQGELILTAGSFLACTPGIQLRPRFGGLKALFSGEGAFVLRASGSGELFFNAYGAVVERTLDGELRVDTGHAVAWEPSLDYSLSGMGGLKSTLFSGEGLTMTFRGSGRIWLQTRHLSATAGWLSPFCMG